MIHTMLTVITSLYVAPYKSGSPVLSIHLGPRVYGRKSVSTFKPVLSARSSPPGAKAPATTDPQVNQRNIKCPSQ